MAQNKKSFLLYADWKDVFDELPNEEAGKLIKHIFAYVNDEDPKSDSILINAVFANIKSTLKRDLDKWENQLEQRREAGRKSAQARANKLNDNTTESNERSTSVEIRRRNPTDNVNVNVNVNDNVITNSNNNNIGTELKFGADVLPAVKEKKKFVKPTVEEIQQYCISRKNNIDAEAFFSYYESVGWKVGRNVMKSWQSAVITWEKRNKQNNGTNKEDNLNSALSRF